MDEKRPESAGIVLLALGILGMALGWLHQVHALPSALAVWWGRAEVLLLFASVALALVGMRLMWSVEHAPVDWSPTEPGARFTSAVLYTRKNCHLCEEAAELLARYRKLLPPLIDVDIDADPELAGRFSECVPVVEFDGKVRFRGRVSEALLQRLIEGTPPAAPNTRRVAS